jgi:hypothetical protein
MKLKILNIQTPQRHPSYLWRSSSGELTLWFRPSKPDPDPAANIIVEEADPGPLEG